MKNFLNLFLLALAISCAAQSAMAQEWPVNSVATSSAIWPNDNIKDGNPGTVWSSDGHGDASHAEWLAYWFDGFHPVNFIKLYPRLVNGKALGFPTDFNVYWSDGTSWNLAKSFTNVATPQSAGYVTFSLPATLTANGIQVVTNKLGVDDFNNYYFQIAEVGAGYGIGKPAIDFFGNPLPGAPIIKSTNNVPKTVTVDNIEVNLYRVAKPDSDPANEGTPDRLKTYGGVTRECLKINPVKPGQNWTCFSTFPYERTLWESPEIDAVCGYRAPPAVVVACNDGECVSEFFMHACETGYPSLSTSTSYNTEKTDVNFGGYIGAPEELPKQGFSTKYDATANLNTAMEILRQGRTPVIAIGALLFDREGIALPCPNAPQTTTPCSNKLDAAIAKYPQLFGPGAFLSVMDEPFNEHNGASEANRSNEIESLNKGIELVRTKIPGAQIGFIVAGPHWGNPEIKESIKQVIDRGQLQWIAMDIYMTQFDAPDAPVQVTKDFSFFMGDPKYHNMEKWLVVQGFAPPFLNASSDCAPCPLCDPLAAALPCPAVPPAHWNEAAGKDLKENFKKFMGKMAEAARSYTGVIVWGWNSVSELDDAFAGKNFPDDIKQIYQKPGCSSITFTPASIPSNGGIASAQAKCTDGALSYTWTVDGTVYPGNLSTNSTQVSPNTSTLPKRFNVCVTANNIGGQSQPVCALLTQAAAVQTPLPSAPIIGTAVVGKGSASVYFTPGAPGTGTLVKYTAACGGTSASGTSSPIVVNGLAQGTTYFCHVKTTTSKGTSPWSEWSNSVTPVLPAAPTCSSLTLSSNSVPAEGGLVTGQVNCKGTVTSYVWTVNGKEISGDLSGNSSSVGLNTTKLPIKYAVCVSARNAGGQSQAVCKTLTHAAAVDPVCSLTLSASSVPANGGLVQAAATCSGNGLTYEWRVNGEIYPGSSSTNSSTVGASTSTLPVTYTVCVVASSTLGLGQSKPACKPLIQAGATSVPPSAPIIGSAVVVGNDAASVSFTPSALGSGTFSNYTAACSGTFASGTNSPIVVTGLLKGSAYFCHVKVTTTAGTSAWSEWSNPVFP